MADSQELYEVDEKILGDSANEERNPFEYWLNAVLHFRNVLHAQPKLRTTPLSRQLDSLLEFWDAEPSDRNNEKAREAFIDLSVYGTVGKALWYLRNKDDAQLRKELIRFANEPEALVGNLFLFYIAGTLASKGYGIDFVPERGKHAEQTPDLRAEKDKNVIWIEANAKQPKRSVDTPERISQLIRDIIEEKKQKFARPEYWPGIIVADISPIQHLVNENGTRPLLKLRRDLLRPLGSGEGEFLYRLYEDPDWEQQPENQGNVFAYLIREFAAIDRSRYNVTQCLLTISRQVWQGEQGIAFPKGHQLLVCRSAEADALLDLSRQVYVV